MTLTSKRVLRSDAHHHAQIHGAHGDEAASVVIGDRVDATLTLEDGRTVQVGVLADGHVLVRAWAADPYATDNAEAVSISFTLPTLEDMVLDGAQPGQVTLRTSARTERYLTRPDRDGCWHLSGKKVHDRVTALRTLLALRGTITPEENQT